MGYERYDLVETQGCFSIRGGILDIAISEKEGIRIELWGDEIDSIRKFSLVSQRSNEMLEKVSIFPVTEFILEDNLNTVIERILKREDSNEEQITEDLEEIKQGDFLPKVDRYFNSFYTKQETFLDYITDNYIIFLDEVSKIKARNENILKDSTAILSSLTEKKKILPDSILNLISYVDFLNNIKQKQIVYLEKQDIGFIDKQTMHAKRNGYSFSYREVNFFRSSMDLLFEEVQKASIDEKYIVILRRNSRK